VTGDRLKRGDYVRVRLDNHRDDDWTPAFVALASGSDPSSVMLAFDGAVRDGRGGLIANVLPLTIDYGAEKVTSLWGDSYEIEIAA
jgi:hypothetical protein